MWTPAKHFFIFILVLQCYFLAKIVIRPRFKYLYETKAPKYVGIHLNGGRMGNQLFHLITGYGIARTLGRIHYLPYEGLRTHVLNYLDIFKVIFPRLEETYVIAENHVKQRLIPFAGSCCVYDNPMRIINETDQYLLLNFMYAQNPRYFEPYIQDVRQILEFSSNTSSRGQWILDVLKIKPKEGALCIHIRRTDFIERNIATDITATVKAAKDIAKRRDSTAAAREEKKIAARFATILRGDAATFVEVETNEDLDAGDSTDDDSDWDYNDDEGGSTTSGNEVYFGTSAISPDQKLDRFIIFGDDKEFMDEMGRLISNSTQRNSNRSAVLVSQFDEGTDLYISSRMCQSFLITAVTSTFGWWLAFFAPNQDAVYYMPDHRIHGDKVPSKELFLKSWQEYR